MCQCPMPLQINTHLDGMIDGQPAMCVLVCELRVDVTHGLEVTGHILLYNIPHYITLFKWGEEISPFGLNNTFSHPFFPPSWQSNWVRSGWAKGSNRHNLKFMHSRIQSSIRKIRFSAAHFSELEAVKNRHQRRQPLCHCWYSPWAYI